MSLPAEPLKRPAPRASVAWTVRGAFVAIVVLSGLHYATQTGHGNVHEAHHTLHAILRRAMTIPVVLAGVMGGRRAGALAGALAVVLYLPHAFFAARASALLGVMIHADPSSLVEKVSEVVLYLVLGPLTGMLVEEARRARRAEVSLSARLSATEQDLLRADRLAGLGELAAGIAHEVRNPLAALRTTGELLAEACPEGHPRHRMAVLHLEEIDRLGRVVGRFLDFARPRPPDTRTTALAPLVHRVKDLLLSTARQRDVSVAVVEDAPVEARVDGDQIVQLVLNLGLNAVQASGPGDTVELAVVVDDGAVAIEVRDRGPGIPALDQERVFDPCFTTRPDGSGLGLAIASRIAFAHDARLTLDPRAGGGTVARLLIRAEAP